MHNRVKTTKMKLRSPAENGLVYTVFLVTNDFTHTSDMDAAKITTTLEFATSIHFTRIQVGCIIDGAWFGLSPEVTKEQRIEVKMLVKKAFANLTEDLEGDYFPLAGMEENVFASGNKNLLAAC